MKKAITKIILIFSLLLGLSLTGIAAGDEGVGSSMISDRARALGQSMMGNIDSCTIAGTDMVEVTGSLGNMGTDDNILYLFELESYESDISSKNPIDAISKSNSFVFHVPLNLNTTVSKLYSKFAVGVKQGGAYVPVTEARYITNPEAVAQYGYAFPSAASKKGLLLNNSSLMYEDAGELGVKHTIFNIDYSALMANGDQPFTYNGRVYYINRAMLASYDHFFQEVTNRNMIVSCVLLVGTNVPNSDLIHPNASTSSGAHYYAMNTQTAAGIDCVSAITHFLAERYSDPGRTKGLVVNWIVGNEINNPNAWNCAGNMDFQHYIQDYVRSIRLVNSAIKSVYSNARIYASLDHIWNRVDASVYGSREVLDTINQYVNQEGKIPWEVAYHAYSVPLDDPVFWDDPVNDDPYSTPYVTMKNIHVLTNYMNRGEIRNPDGSVKHVILSEQGFTSLDRNKENVELTQAAAYAYAYRIAEVNPYIDSFILNRQVSHSVEVRQGLDFGLWNTDLSKEGEFPTTRKYIWNVFKYADTDRFEEVAEFAKPIIGISSWPGTDNSEPGQGSGSNGGLAITSIRISEESEEGYKVEISFHAPAGVEKVLFPTWTSANGQDDIIWEEGVVRGNTAAYYVETGRHNNESGEYNTHVYLYDQAGNQALQGISTFVKTAASGSGKLSVSTPRVVEQDEEGYVVEAEFSTKSGLDKVLFPTWTSANGQDDILWEEGVAEGNKARYYVEYASHGNESGVYNTHVYVYDKNGESVHDGISIQARPAASSQKKMSISNIHIAEQDEEGYVIEANFTTETGVDRVLFPTWTSAGGQDDITWEEGVVEGNKVRYYVEYASHRNESGIYNTHIYVYDRNGESVHDGISTEVKNVPGGQKMEISNIRIAEQDEEGYVIEVSFTTKTGVDRVIFPTWTSANGQDDITWEEGVVEGNKARYYVEYASHGNESGVYNTHVYVYDRNGESVHDGISKEVKNGNSSGQKLSIRNIRVSELTEDGYKVEFDFTAPKGVDRILFPTWTSANGQDDITWEEGVVRSNTAAYYTEVSNHNGESGVYNTHIYLYDREGNVVHDGVSVNVPTE